MERNAASVRAADEQGDLGDTSFFCLHGDSFLVDENQDSRRRIKMVLRRTRKMVLRTDRMLYCIRNGGRYAFITCGR